MTPDYEAPSGVYDGALSGPPELVLALSAADSATGGATIDQRALLATLGLLDGEALVADLQPIAAVIAAPLLTLRLELRLRGVPVIGEGWLDRDQAVLGVPESADDDAAVRLLCFPTVRLEHSLAGFLDLGPRPSREDLGGLLVGAAALERLLGSGASPERARAELELDDAAADGALTALCRRESLHWRLELHDAPSAGRTFSRRTEAVDAGADGLWLIGPSADETLVLVVPATTTQLWRLLTTMLPTHEETAAILAARSSGIS